MPAAAITVLQNIDIILRAKNRGHHGVCAACRPEFESWARLMATQQLLRLPQLHATDLTRVHLAPGRNREPVVIKAFCADIPEHSLEREAAALLRLQARGVDCAPRLLAQLTMRLLDVDVPVLALEYFPPACHLAEPSQKIHLSGSFFQEHPHHQAALDEAYAQTVACLLYTSPSPRD